MPQVSKQSLFLFFLKKTNYSAAKKGNPSFAVAAAKDATNFFSERRKHKSAANGS